MIQYHIQPSAEDKLFVLGYCRDNAHTAYSTGDYKGYLFWSKSYVEFMQEWRTYAQTSLAIRSDI